MPRPQRCFNIVSEIATKYNYLLIRYWTENKNSKVDVVCSQGHLTTKFTHAIHNNCFECKISHNKLTQIQVAERLAEKGFQLVGDYINAKTRVTVICKRGHQTQAFFNQVGCMKCMSIDRSYKLSEIQTIFQNQGYKLITNELDPLDLGLKPSLQSFKYICPVGHQGQTDVTNFLRGKRCRKCWNKSNRQENHYAWNPELTQKDRLTRRHFPETREWRTAVFERDSYTCQVCQQLGNKLVAHHLNGWDKHPNQRFDINNGVTLCQKCHKQFHSVYGNKKNTKNQYTEWLKLNHMRTLHSSYADPNG